ncbi:F0F1 ATP synthase subunit B' [Rhodobaculum claviforme]|uniref:ATP synthase subunit b n=1 Tax=Rhodobaculum claviforme TaxID=1549854 RepID=A0A934TJ50_9RHOB|nr:F0F1 ATP synthase subunit B' [Rhodobaculum claviforme]MBK5926767.1 ATP F0F1 synthase subunit B' [Rhodobaculum claviforme]
MNPETGQTVAADQAVGMPQLDFSTFPNQIFWLVVALVAIWLILTRVALPRIGAVLAERRGAITNDIARAEALKLQAEEAGAAYDKALADARAKAQRIIEKTKAEMQEQLDIALQKADAEIAAKTAESERRLAAIRDSASAAVEEVARETARDVLAAFGAKADATTVDAAVASRIKEGAA